MGLAVLHAIGANQDAAFVEIDLRPEKPRGLVAAQGREQQELDEIAHRLVLDRGPDGAKLLDGRDVVASLAGSWGARSGRSRRKGCVRSDAACGTTTGSRESAPKTCRRSPAEPSAVSTIRRIMLGVEPRRREGLGPHEADGLARIVNRLTPCGLAGFAAGHDRLLVGIEGSESVVGRAARSATAEALEAIASRCGSWPARMRALAASAAVRASASERAKASPISWRTPPPQRLPVVRINALRLEEQAPEGAPGGDDQREAFDLGILCHGGDKLALDAPQGFARTFSVIFFVVAGIS